MMVVKTKKAKGTKTFVIKKIRYEDYKNCLQATQLENKRNHPEKSKVNVDSLRGDHKALVKNNAPIKKTKNFLLKKLIRLV